jgi:PRC-barrel domain
MITTEAFDRMIGADALDSQEDRIGEVSQIYVDEQTDRPTWVSVRLGLLSGAEVLVPLADAEWDDRALHVAIERQTARDAPRKEMDEPLTVGEQERLYTHYGIPTERHCRSELGLMEVAPEEISYSVREESFDEDRAAA